jgi:Protein of unknown function, DUF481
MKRTTLLFVVLAVSAAACAARADVVYFTNGDRLTGKIVSAADGKLVIETKAAGKVTVDLHGVKTFSTEAPIEIKTLSGQIIKQKAAASQQGTIALPPVGTLPARSIALGDIGQINPPPVHWTGSVVANAQLIRSDTSSDQFGITANAVRTSAADRITLEGAYLYGKSKPRGQPEQTTADNWFVSGEYDRFFTKRFYGYGNGRVEKDRINYLNLRLTPGAGGGYDWITRPDLNFRTEAGLAYVYQDYGDSGGIQQNVSGRLAYHVDATFFDKRLSVFHDFQFFPDLQNLSHYLILTDVGLRTAITSQLFSQIKLTVNFDSDPAPEARKTDETLLFGLGYNF